MTEFQIVSDLHIEFKNDKVPDPLTLITPSADILIMAGDIGSLYKMDQLSSFLEKLCPYFKNVIYVPGNHEYYEIQEYSVKSVKNLFQDLKDLEKIIKNLIILDRECLRIGNTLVIGCTLWSEPVTRIPKYIVRIPDMNTHKYFIEFKTSKNYIKKMIRYAKIKGLKTLVVTHHSPTYSVITSKKKLSDRYVSLYASELDNLLVKEMVHTWVCGHIHSNFDIISEGGTRVVGNQLGKPKDKIKDYQKDFVIKV